MLGRHKRAHGRSGEDEERDGLHGHLRGTKRVVARRRGGRRSGRRSGGGRKSGRRSGGGRRSGKRSTEERVPISDDMKMLAHNVLIVRARQMSLVESTAAGAAYLAGLATGVWKNLADLETHRSIDRVFEPGMPVEERERLMHWWRKAVDRTRDWTEDE